EIEISVLNKENEKIIDSGSVIKEIYVKPTASEINIDGPDEINLSNGKINKEFNISVKNQAGKIIEKNETVFIELVDSSGEKVFQTDYPNPAVLNYTFEKNFPAGNAYIKAYYKNLYEQEKTEVLEFENLEYNFSEDNETINFENTGNIKYDNTFLLNVSGRENNSERIPINLSLDIGEKEIINFSEELNESGNYTIQTPEGESASLTITGKAISVPEEFNLVESPYVSASILGVIILIILIVVFRKKIKKILKKKPKKNKEEPHMNDKEKQKKGFFSGFLASSKTGKKEKNQTEQGKNTEKERPEEKKQEFVILLVRSLKGIENYKEILEKKDFDFKKINENLGYVLVHNKEGKALRNKIYEFAENLIEES
ncbi:MAG: hypothetical protein ACOC1P_06365, partial [Minisyncoccales bacterium]